MVTAGTYEKRPYFRAAERLTLLETELLRVLKDARWELHAWVVLENHYHFLALCPDEGGTLGRPMGKLHMTTAKAVNAMDATPGRKVWHQNWETRITFERSYLARLNYVLWNPVRHGLVPTPTAYAWSSARVFFRHATPAFRRTVAALPIDTVNVADDF